MSDFINKNYIPVKVHIKEQPKMFDRFGAQWTPTLLFMDPEGTERHRVEGFLPVEDMQAHLRMGLAKIAFTNGRFDEAQKLFREVLGRHTASPLAAEAAYWDGVSAYKATNDASALKKTGEILNERYPGTEWARKGSVWIDPASAKGKD